MKTIDGTIDQSKLSAARMTENFHMDISAIPGDTPKNREAATRLQDQLTTDTKDIPGALLEANKLERTPLLAATPERVAVVKDDIKDAYRGPWNSLLNVIFDKNSWNS